MKAHLQTLLHLASVIDLKREKLESALTTGRREQLTRQIDLVSESFRKEYAEVMAADQGRGGQRSQRTSA